VWCICGSIIFIPQKIQNIKDIEACNDFLPFLLKSLISLFREHLHFDCNLIIRTSHITTNTSNKENFNDDLSSNPNSYMKIHPCQNTFYVSNIIILQTNGNVNILENKKEGYIIQ